MRQWNINPKYLCRNHLLGEHNETHKLAGCLMKNRSVKGHIDKGQLEIHNTKKRHDELAEEMKDRGMNHKSPFPKVKLFLAGKINIYNNYVDLMNRCPECKSNIEKAEGFRNI